jgi:hypothetical protein
VLACLVSPVTVPKPEWEMGMTEWVAHLQETFGEVVVDFSSKGSPWMRWWFAVPHARVPPAELADLLSRTFAGGLPLGSGWSLDMSLTRRGVAGTSQYVESQKERPSWRLHWVSDIAEDEMDEGLLPAVLHEITRVIPDEWRVAGWDRKSLRPLDERCRPGTDAVVVEYDEQEAEVRWARWTAEDLDAHGRTPLTDPRFVRVGYRWVQAAA